MKRKNYILLEEEASQKYMLKTIKSKGKKYPGITLVKLTADNVARAEAMFHTDSNYNKSIRSEIDTSSAHSIVEFKKLLYAPGRVDRSRYVELIAEIIKRLDNENSTHLTSDKVGRDQITERIEKIKRKDLQKYLECPVETDYKLFKIIAEKTVPTDKRHNGRNNPSFASKFCHYMCLHMYRGKPEQDNYPIYDSVERKVLPLYVDHYNLQSRDLSDYKNFVETVDEVIKASNEDMSRNGFDHLIWYYFKGSELLKNH